MAALFDSDSEEEEFIGFTIEPGFERNYPESESDISVSSVDTEDLSDLDLSDQESGEEDKQEWNDDPGPVVVNPFVANTSLVRDVRGYSTINFFNLMFKDSNFDKIAEETNCYARQAMETKPDPAWRETDTEEVKAFFALIFPRNRFAKISQYLHLNDKRRELPRGHANHNKLFKVRPLLDSVVEAIKSEYRPSKNVSIDEAMIPFKGRLSLKQYMPLKPVKRGIKVWECADSSNGFICDLEVYTGKQRNGNPEQGLGHRVVRNLTRPLVGKNHHVFVDNFFNSLALTEDLLRDQIYICGTIRGNRQGIPRAISPKTQRVK